MATAGRWKVSHDQLWQVLNARHGQQNGTRLMVEVIGLGREHGYDRLENAIEKALGLGCSDAEAIRYLLMENRLERKPSERVAIAALAGYDRPLPTLKNYDCLLSRREVQA